MALGALLSIGSAIVGGLSAVCTAVGSVCTAVCGTASALGTAMSGAVGTMIKAISVALPNLKIVEAVLTVANIVSQIAQLLGLKEQGKDEPDELAMKAEKSDRKPEDFDLTEDYIKHLQNEVELTDEDKEKLENMDPEKRAAYRAVGTYLYTKGINEKLGLDTTGLKNAELVGVTCEILADIAKLVEILSPSDFVKYSKHLQAGGLSMDDFSKYLHGTSTDVEIDKKVQNAISNAMKEINPSLTEEEIDKKLIELNIEA